MSWKPLKKLKCIWSFTEPAIVKTEDLADIMATEIMQEIDSQIIKDLKAFHGIDLSVLTIPAIELILEAARSLGHKDMYISSGASAAFHFYRGYVEATVVLGVCPRREGFELVLSIGSDIHNINIK